MQAQNPSSSAGETSTNALEFDDDVSYVALTKTCVDFKELAR